MNSPKLSPTEIKNLLKLRLQLGEWFPCKRIEDHFHVSLNRFEVRQSGVCKRGSHSLGLFLKSDSSPILPSELIGIYTGILSSGFGSYHLDLSATIKDTIIDGTPHPEHPMTCFGRINEDIYDNKVNVRFGPDGSITVINTIFPGDELLVEYGDDYRNGWN